MYDDGTLFETSGDDLHDAGIPLDDFFVPSVNLGFYVRIYNRVSFFGLIDTAIYGIRFFSAGIIYAL